MNRSSAFNAEQGSVASGAYTTLVLLGLTYTFSFLDRQIVAILAEPIKADLNLSDTQVGLLTGFMFALFYTTFGIPVAWLADRTHRVRIVAASCALWSVFTAACGLATTFWQLALARIGVGIGEAGGTPPAYSILSDMFPPARRAMALALYSLGVPAGVILGGVFGGMVADLWGWRMAFFAVGAPGVLIASLLLIFVREPKRVRLDEEGGAPISQPSLWQTLRFYFGSPVLVCIALSSGLSGFVGYAILNWTPALLMRTKGMTLSDVASYYSWVIGIAMGLGIWLGGYLVDRFGAERPRLYAIAPGLAFLIGAPFFVMAVLVPHWQASLLLMSVPAIMAMMYLAPALAVLQNTTPANMRSTTSAVLLLILNLIGLGCGPLFIGVLSDMLEPQFGADALRLAMLGLSPIFILTFGAHFLTSKFIGAGVREG